MLELDGEKPNGDGDQDDDESPLVEPVETDVSTSEEEPAK
ncbi:hypothetical protein QFZ33_000023 [Arthrobacter globiformis]|nr:hypothetical protein [Arthrobacter globiformis]